MTRSNPFHDYLRSVPLFRGLSGKELDVVGQAITELPFGAGDVLIHEGATANEMYIVIEGEFEVTKEGEHVADVGQGGVLGEMALLTHAHRHATVTAKTPARVLHVDGRQFANVLDEVPTIGVKMLPIVASRVIENSDHHQH